MKKRALCVVIGLFVAAMIIAQAQAETFSSKKGYTLTYPADWKVASDDQRGRFEDMINTGADADSFRMEVDTLIYKGEYVNPLGCNASVMVIPVPLKATEEQAKKTADMVLGGLRKGGLEPTNIKVGVERVGKYDAVSIQYDTNIAGYDFHNWVINVPGKTQTYSLGFQVSGPLRADNEATIKEMAASFTLTGGLGAFWYSLPGPLQKIIIAVVVVIVLVVLLLIWIKRKKKK